MSSLDSAILVQLRSALEAARTAQDARLLHADDLVALSAALPDGLGVTIDCTATPVLGQPLVVVQRGSSSPERFSGLTRREREVADCVGRGMSNRSIADRLSLSTATVKDHVHRILAKTGCSNRTALAIAWRQLNC